MNRWKKVNRLTVNWLIFIFLGKLMELDQFSRDMRCAPQHIREWFCVLSVGYVMLD